jgi:type II secretory pathway pseudopilin PulG
VLGLIAALTLPTIFNAVKTQRDKALFKEAFNTLQNSTYQAYMNGATTTDQILPYINSTKTCQTNYNTQGCYTALTPNGAIDAGVVLASGAVIVDFDQKTEDDGVVIDINGMSSPNLNGQDRFFFIVNLRSSNITFNGITARPGEVKCNTAAVSTCEDWFK